MSKNISLIFLLILLTCIPCNLNYICGSNIYPEYITKSEQNIVYALNKINSAEKFVEVNECVSMLNEAVQYLINARIQYDKTNYIDATKLSDACNEVTFRIIKELDVSLNKEIETNMEYETHLRIIILFVSLTIIYYVWLKYKTLYKNKIWSYRVAVTE